MTQPPRDPLSLPAILDVLGLDLERPDAPLDPVLALRRVGVLLGLPDGPPAEPRAAS